jgi:hypothetical protein
MGLRINRLMLFSLGFWITVRVTALEMSPLDDQFLAGSEEAVRLWDLRSPNCQVTHSVLIVCWIVAESRW